jgi:hypothetical protein
MIALSQNGDPIRAPRIAYLLTRNSRNELVLDTDATYLHSAGYQAVLKVPPVGAQQLQGGADVPARSIDVVGPVIVAKIRTDPTDPKRRRRILCLINPKSTGDKTACVSNGGIPLVTPIGMVLMYPGTNTPVLAKD